MQIMEGSVDKISFLTKRELGRKLDLQKRKNEKTSLGADHEKLGYFEETFTERKIFIENLIEQAKVMEKTQLPDQFNQISKEILLLQKYVAASNIFLRTYDIKKCQEGLQELTNKAKELENELLPKKKFGFKSKPNVKPKVNKTPDEIDCCSSKTFTTKEFFGLTNRKNETLIMVQEEIYKKDVSAENLENCIVKLFGSPSTLHLSGLKDCHVFTGPVSTSIFAENCQNCTFVIACQQLRLHASQNINIYLYVTSRAIMEDCNEIKLAPYNWSYEKIEQDFENSGLNQSVNNWQCVDDFNWLNVEKHSPNWSVLSEKDIIKHWDQF